MNPYSYVYILLFFFSSTTSVLSQSLTNHMFNADLTTPDTKQISLALNFKTGINEELEVGSNAFLLSAGIKNFSLKHVMFQTEAYKTSFWTYNFFGSTDESDIINAGLYGFITTLTHTHSTQTSIGLNKAHYSISESIFSDYRTEVDFYYASLAVDHYLRGDILFTAVTMLPVYQSISLNDDYAMAELKGFSFPGFYEGAPIYSLVTLTKNAGNTNIEAGFLYVAGSPTLYFNAFWKWM